MKRRGANISSPFFMITLYSGVPGSGKSLHVIRDIKFALKQNQEVITNFPINTAGIKTNKHPIILKHSDLENPRKLISILNRFLKEDGRKKQTLIILDECQIYFDSRGWNGKDRKEWNIFFSQHRKLNCNIILVTQSFESIDKRIRANVETVVYHRNLKRIGNIGFFLTLFGILKIFIGVEQYIGMPHEIIGRYIILGKKSLYNMYDTYALFGQIPLT